MIQKILSIPLLFLQTLGETVVSVIKGTLIDLTEFALLTFKLVWGKTIKIREKILNIVKYISVFFASPFVKLWFNFQNMKEEMRVQNQSSGFIGAMKAGLPYFMRFTFGKRGLAVTAFNYIAPILSIAFLFNVVTYATSSNFTLKLVVNGEFLGYIESEQVFLDAQADALQRVNYVGSDNVIEIIAEFSITNSGSTERLTHRQVANAILENSDFTLKYAYGFFIDGICYGAFLESDKPLIDTTITQLLSEYSTGEEDEHVDFLNHVQWDEYAQFLEESVVNPREIIAMITATKKNAEGEEEPYLPVAVTRTMEYEVPVAFLTETRMDDNRFIGQTMVSQSGADGVSQVTAKVSFVNGVEVSRNVIDTQEITPPKPRIVLHGTKPVEDKEISPMVPIQGQFIWPTNPSLGITQGFRSGHTAIDISGSGARRSPVFAAGDGEVIEVSWIKHGYGHHIIIQHGEEHGFLKSLYSHNDQQIVTIGQRVTAGEQIATIGTTGRTEGPHLHFEIMEGTRRLDPRNYVKRP